MTSDAEHTCSNCDSDDIRIDYVDLDSDAFGLPNVRLKNATEITCNDCDAVIIEIPRAGMLIDRVRRGICWLGRALTGSEMAFLRQSLGYTGIAFASIINVTNVSVSRWENGSQDIPQTVELLLRVITLSDLGQIRNLLQIIQEISISELVDIEIDLHHFVESTNKIQTFVVPDAVPMKTGINTGSRELIFDDNQAVEVALNG